MSHLEERLAQASQEISSCRFRTKFVERLAASKEVSSGRFLDGCQKKKTKIRQLAISQTSQIIVMKFTQ